MRNPLLSGGRSIAVLSLSALLLAGCAPSLGVARNHFASYERLVAELQRLRDAHSGIVSFERIGTTYEGRTIFAVRVGGDPPAGSGDAALLAIFGEHGDEHDVIALGMGLIEQLAASYGEDPEITRLLDRKAVWVVPMMKGKIPFIVNGHARDACGLAGRVARDDLGLLAVPFLQEYRESDSKSTSSTGVTPPFDRAICLIPEES